MRVRTVLLILALVAVVLAALGGVLLWRGGAAAPVVASSTVLELDLTAGFPEDLQVHGLALPLGDRILRLREAVSAIRRAAGDDRVIGLVAKTGASPGGLATLQELREALAEFRDSGKTMVAYSETFGEFGPSNGGYYLASIFPEINLQPSGDVGLTGLHYEVPFLAGTFELLGLEPQIEGRHEYKNAMNTYTEREFTEWHEEALSELAEEQFGQMVSAISASRDLEETKVRALFDGGPYFGQEAVAAGLVDRLAYRDEVYDRLEEELGERVVFRELDSYGSGLGGLPGRTTVALIYGVGGIVRGKGGYDPFADTTYLGADTVAEAFRDAVEDDAVDAILFRVNSPGGSYVASDTIWRETVRARDAGKPVVVSIGDVGGSGGYFIAMNADQIIAQPGTITGSIGVYGGKMVVRDMLAKAGFSSDSVATSENAEMWSSMSEFDERGWQRMRASLDRIYADFVGKVAAGRELDPDHVDRVARGRIWSGERALELGLVDALGGFPEAYAAVRDELGLDEDAKLQLRQFPHPKSSWEMLFEQFSRLGTPARGAASSPSLAELRRLAGVVLETARPRGVLEMPFVPVPN